MKKTLLAAALGAGILAGVSRKTRKRAAKPASADQAMRRYISYVVLPVWLAFGFLDYIWHRRTSIETTAGLSESLMHSLMMVEASPAVFGALFLEINAGVLAMIFASALLHEATAIWDVTFTSSRRPIRPAEQHTHSFLEMVPFCVASAAACLNWDQCLALIGRGTESPDFAFRLRRPMVAWQYLLGALGAFTLLGGLPHLDELRRCIVAQQRGLVGQDTPECARELFA